MCKQLLAFSAIPFFISLTGCDADDVFAAVAQERQDFHYAKPLNQGGRFSIENTNGSVEISGWDKDEVDISGTKYARTKAHLDEMKIDVQASNGMVSIRTIPPIDRSHSNAGAKYIIRVPRRVAVELAASSNGSIQLTSVEGAAKIRTSNGRVTAKSVKGLLDITTTNGDVDIVDVTGGVRVSTSNGTVDADNLHGEFNAKTTNGGINARLFDIPANSPVKAATSNGPVDLTVDQVRGDIRASTNNGHINLRLPSNTNAKVDAHTSNSNVTSDLAVTGGSTASKKHLEGTLGSGGPHIDLSTSNGAIRLMKGASI